MVRFYYLDGREPRSCTADVAASMLEHNNTVAYNLVGNHTSISTVFLFMDHRLSGEGPPLVFETMIFGGQHDQYQERYSTYDEAEAGHKRAVQLVLSSLVTEGNNHEPPREA